MQWSLFTGGGGEDPAPQVLPVWFDPSPKASSPLGGPVDAEDMQEWVCPISGHLVVEPVITIYGHVFERSELLKWLRREGRPRCPVTGLPLIAAHVYPFPEAEKFVRDVAHARRWELHRGEPSRSL